VEHMDDLPGEDIWYSRDEYDEIKNRNSNIVRLIKSGDFEENDQFSCRGLEHKLKEVFRQRRANKFNALNAVLEEQDRQINRGINDDDLISKAYLTVAAKCQESANTIGFRDYRFSYNYDPNKPATGFDQPLPAPEGMGDSQSKLSKKDKKEKKKEKKEMKQEKKEKKLEKKLEKKEKKLEKKLEKKEKKLAKKLAKKQKKELKKQKKLEKKLAKKAEKLKKKGEVQTEEEEEEDDDDDSSSSESESDESENDEDPSKSEQADPPLSPNGVKKKRQLLKGGRRMMRRMSM
jgi:isoleucyl-tRNA synthetase